MIDIIHEINVETTIEEDIRLSILLHTYASNDIYKQFVHDKKIDEYIVRNDLDNMTFDEIVAIFSPKRFDINKLKNPLDGSTEYDKYVWLWNNLNSIYINSRTVFPYIKENFVRMFYHVDEEYIIIPKNSIGINSLKDLPKLVSVSEVSQNIEQFINLFINEDGKSVIKDNFPQLLLSKEED